jgi:hypothetical protein
LHTDAIRRADPLQKLKRCSITAEENVLPVVDELAGLAVAKGGRTAAELRSRVDDQDALSLFRKCGTSAEASKSSAHHDNEI